MEQGSGANGRVFIVSAARTPIGKFGGASARPPWSSAGSRSAPRSIGPGLPQDAHIDEVLMGQVLQAGVGQAPARQAALKAGLPETIRATTINRVCGSGLKVDHARRGGDQGGRRRDRGRRRHGEHEPRAVPAAPGRASATGSATASSRTRRSRRAVVRGRGLPHGHPRRARRDPGPRHPRGPGRVRPRRATSARSPRSTPAASTPSWCRSPSRDAKGRETLVDGRREPAARHDRSRRSRDSAGVRPARRRGPRRRDGRAP